MALMTQVGLEIIARDRSRAGMAQFNRGITSMTRSILQLAGIGGGIYMLQRGFRDTIAEASSAQETFAKFDVVFRDQSASARKWAEDFGDSVGRATHDVAGWMAGLQDTFVPLGIARDKAAELSKSLVKLAVDVASFNNKADADVIRDFTSALVGNHETVRKYGIIISENAIKQESLRQGLNKTYAELTDLEKVQLRYNLIQAGTTDAQGDAIRTADSYANQVKRLSANWKEFQVELGGPVIQSLAEIMEQVNKNSEAWSRFFKIQAEGWTEILSGFESVKTVIHEYNKSMEKRGLVPKGGYTYGSWAPLPSSEATKGELPVGKLEIPPRRQQYLEEMRQRARLIDEAINYKGALPGTEYRIEQAEKITDVEKVVNADVLADTRDYLSSVRSMHDRTRMEKIQMLEEYRAKHAEIMFDVAGAETEAGELIRKEIDAIRESRIAGMDIYRAELQEDMENTSLYISDKFAEAGRSIEGSMSGAFQAMISDGASFRDAMVQFFNDIGRAFSRMAADMIARSVMESWLAPLLGGMAGMFSGGLGGSAAAPTYVPHHEGWIPEYHGGRRIMPNEHLALIENDEWVVPGSKVTRGGSAAAPSIVIYNESGQAIEKKGEPQFDGESWVISLIARNYTQGGSLKKLIR